MDDDQWIALCEKKSRERNRMQEVFDRYSVVRQDWSCECGSKFKWYSIHHEERHMTSGKHQSYLANKNKCPKSVGLTH